MIINHNISALNTHRQLGANTNAVQSSLEKLSSGLKINRAGDDAAGLAISEKMRGQIRGLEMATKNAQDGISLIQTAEGALNESHAILQRMRELAVQAASDTNTEADRAELQKEVDQLAEELTRIADNTEFNTQKLLNGEFKATFHIGANEGQNISIDIGAMGAEVLQVGEVAVAGENGEITVRGTDYTFYNEGDEIVAGDPVEGDPVEGDPVEGDPVEGDPVEGDPVEGDPDEGTEAIRADVAGYCADDGTFLFAADEALSEGDEVAFGIDISSQESADEAITTINNAIETVSSERSKLGAVQNRLEHTINNLGASAENLQAAESRIRDTDMAKEMMEFTKNNILTQAAQAMLAQSQQIPQGVLQLLR